MRSSTTTLMLSLMVHSLSSVALTAENPERGGPIRTEIVERGGHFVLLRDGQPYTIRGAGIEKGDLSALVARGGNSIRNWSTHSAREMLDHAQQLGVTISLCLNVSRERHGFNYDVDEAIARQFAEAKADVLRYRNHPALLSWIIGNELNHDFKNPRVFDAVNDISKMIHRLDPNHPTTTTLANFSDEMARLMNARAADLDFVSIQSYGDLVNLPRYIRQSRFTRPIMITEWGAIGHWEVTATPWGAPIEQTSSEKANNYRKMHDSVISELAHLSIGSYVFLWGQKQERTATWYGLFTENGDSTEAVDVMQAIWTGKLPANQAPRLLSMRLDGQVSHDNVKLKPGQVYDARVQSSDPDGDTLSYQWEVRHETNAKQVGGDTEDIPPLVTGVIDSGGAAEISVRAPTQPGAYRLFIYVQDGHGHAAHANIPFLVST
jgi:hypothetical protein